MQSTTHRSVCRQRGKTVKSAVIDTVSVKNLFAPFCCPRKRHFLLLDSLRKQLEILVISLNKRNKKLQPDSNILAGRWHCPLYSASDAFL